MMFRKKELLLLSITTIFCCCAESYPSIEDQVMPEQRNVKASSELESDMVPIRPSLDAPDFYISTRGTGSGPFDSWENDKEKEHWKQARFHVFAYQTSNKYGGSVDMTINNDAQADEKYGVWSENKCLLYDKIMMIQDSKTMKFVNPDNIEEERVYYYRINHPNYKYNFFTYFLDDAAKKYTLNQTPQKITLGVEIDGSQDLMHSFAYHTESYYKDLVEQRINENDKDQMKVLTDKDSYANLLYSTATGHRSINPYFKINHLLSKLKIKVRGAKSKDATKNDYKNIIITKIEIESPYKGTLTVADDAWGKLLKGDEASGLGYVYENEYAAGKLIDWTRMDDEGNVVVDKAWLTTPVISNPVSSDSFDEIIHNQIGESLYYHVDSEDEKVLSQESLLLAPGDEYTLTIEGFFINRSGDDDESFEGAYIEPWPVAQNIPVHLNDGKPFEPGKEYTLIIYVYGRQQVGLEVSFGDNWTNGGSIDINKEGNEEGE